MRRVVVIFLILTNFYCFAQTIPTPRGYEILDKANGDLDKDGTSELVVIFNTNESTDDGKIREIQIFKTKGSGWTLWKKSREALLKSEEGGMMGDPFGELQINNNILLISHNGGSSWKWSFIDKYRFQNNEFELIGYTSNYGKPCEYWENVDFNVSTGKIIYKKEYESCESEDQITIKTEEETFVKKGISINLNNRSSKKVKFISPKYKAEIGL